MSAANSTAPAAYEAWGVEGRKPALLGVGATKGDCDRIHRHHDGGGITVRGGVVIAVKTGTVTSAKASLQHAAFAAYRERGDLPAPTETDRDRERAERAEAERERQRTALRLVAPLPEERADEGESDEADETPARAADDRDEPEGDEPEGDESDQDDTDDTSEDTVDRSASTSTPAAPETAPTVPASATCAALGCTLGVGEVRSNTLAEHAVLCPRHRARARGLMRDHGYDAARAVSVLRTTEGAPVPAARTPKGAGASKAAARSKVLRAAKVETVRRAPRAATAPARGTKTTKPQAPRATQPPADYTSAVDTSAVDTIRRLVAVRDQFGSIEAAEEGARIIASLGGVAAAREIVAVLGGAA